MTNTISLDSLEYNSYIQQFEIYPTMQKARAKGFEAHHLIPRYIQKRTGIKDDHCVRVTAFQHILIHYLLAKAFKEDYIYIFYLMYNQNNFKITDYEKLTLQNLKDWAYLREEGIKKISEKNKGKKAWNKGKHQTLEQIMKSSQSHKGYHWWTDGTVQVQSIERPGENFRLGRLKFSEETLKKCP